jgi:hypothetical protein
MTPRSPSQPTDPEPAELTAPPRSRRALLAGLAGGAGALLAGALSRVPPTRAAAGDPLILGQANSSGSAGTSVSSNVNGNAFRVIQSGAGNDANGLRGDANHGTGGVFTSSQNNGVFGITAHPDRRGIWAQNSSGSHGSGAAIRAQGNQNTGLEARTANANAYGVDAVHTATTGVAYAVAGETASTSGRGVLGLATAASGSTIGVLGQSASTSGRGVFGTADASSGETYGVWGQAFSTGGRGVLGWALGSGATRGVWGIGQSASGFGVYSTGNAHVIGNLTVSGTKSFQVDHPLDPANRYLRHHCTEGAEALTHYSGNVTLDASGTAEVALPAWFAGVNEEVRYGLTPLGAAMPELHVAGEVTDNRFTIAGGPPGGRVSWQLSCRRRGVDGPIELDKPEHEKGSYVNPRLYGQPEAKSLRARQLAETQAAGD